MNRNQRFGSARNFKVHALALVRPLFHDSQELLDADVESIVQKIQRSFQASCSS